MVVAAGAAFYRKGAGGSCDAGLPRLLLGLGLQGVHYGEEKRHEAVAHWRNLSLKV